MTKRSVSSGQIEYLKEQIRKKDQKIEVLDGAVLQIAKSMDAVLYEVCKKYGDENKSISIPVPVVEETVKLKVERENDTYIITPVKVDAEDEK